LDTSVPRRAAVDEHRNAIADVATTCGNASIVARPVDRPPQFDRDAARSCATAPAWWAHLVGAFRVHPHNIEPIILRKKIEDLREVRASMSIAI